LMTAIELTESLVADANRVKKEQRNPT
jgi:hypothetical protein